MKEFIRKHYDRIHGVLSCFDRMLFRYLPIMSGWAMAQFINGLDLKGSRLKGFLLESSERVKDHAIAMAQKHARPFQYLVSNIRKEDTARQLAERDGIEEGLVCVFSILEPCRACGQDPKKESAKVSRTFRRFHAHGLIAKVPRTRRWRITLYGRSVMGTSLYLRNHHFPEAYSRMAA
jgi:hypothetical protein